MKLYHGSKNGQLDTIKKSQAEAGEGVEVPEDELLNAIYLTPDYGFALAMAIRPMGLTTIDDDNKTIKFENPELFDPNDKVYIYEIDVPDEQARQIDERQWVIENLDEIKPDNKFEHSAGDIEQYYELVNWKKEESESNSNPEFRIGRG